MRRVVFAASVGNGLEWFDYAAYGLLATTLAKAFFPEESPAAGLLSTLALFGVAFLVRPVSAFILGRAADRRGRRPVLLLTIAVMSIATLTIAFLPGYDQVGVLAPILLLITRICQGVAVGAEWGVSAAFMSEWAPKSRAGRYASSLGMTVALGTLAASLLVAVISAVSSTAFLEDWGWRIPFLVGGIVGLLGMIARARLPETPEYEAQRTDPPPPKDSLGFLIRRAALLVGITAYWTVLFYTVLTYVPTFVQSHGTLSTADALMATTIGLAILVVLIPIAGLVADRVGIKALAIASAAWTLVLTVPLVLLIEKASVFQLVLALAVWAVALAINGAISPLLAAGLFPTRSRSTWVATTYAVTVALFGGTAPYISEWLIQVTGEPIAFAWLLVAFAAAGVVASVLLPRTPRRP